MIDITNKRFGDLKVIKFIKNDMWVCLCKCGNQKEVFGYNLRKGLSKSCGCLIKKRAKELHFKNLKNKKFGKLTVLKRLDNDIQPSGQRKTKWLCKCECGNFKETKATSLQSGKVKSCGCLSESWIANQIKNYVKNNYKKFEFEKKVIKNPKTKHWLKCDIYIHKNIFIEIHGEQHYKLNAWHVRMAWRKNLSPKNEFENQKYKDKIKKSYYRKNGLYIEIDIRKVDNIKNTIKSIEKRIYEFKNKTIQY